MLEFQPGITHFTDFPLAEFPLPCAGDDHPKQPHWSMAPFTHNSTPNNPTGAWPPLHTTAPHTTPLEHGPLYTQQHPKQPHWSMAPFTHNSTPNNPTGAWPPLHTTAPHTTPLEHGSLYTQQHLTQPHWSMAPFTHNSTPNNLTGAWPSGVV